MPSPDLVGTPRQEGASFILWVTASFKAKAFVWQDKAVEKGNRLTQDLWFCPVLASGLHKT